jgi:demethylspheroidene O-methyltransferase
MSTATWPQGRWRDRLRIWRDRQISRPGFRRWAAACWLTRPIARRRARELFDLVAGFTYSQVLLACVRLRIFERLANGPLALDVLARHVDLSPDAAARLLDAAVALRLLARERPPGALPRYRLGPLGAPMVGNSAITAMVEHHALLYADLADPVALLRSRSQATALAHYWPYAARDTSVAAGAAGPTPEGGPSTAQAVPAADPEAGARHTRYSALMAASQPLVAEEILDACDMRPFRSLLDVGGGMGGFAVTVAQRWPHLQLGVFDLPEVALQARAHLAAQGLGGRVSVSAGSFLRDELPHGADLISLVRVVHDHDDDRALTLLCAVRRALPPHGALLLAEPMADTPGARAMGDAYFGLYLWAMGSGRPRTVEQLGALLAAAGFAAPRLLRNPMPLQTRVLLVRPAQSGESGSPYVKNG